MTMSGGDNIDLGKARRTLGMGANPSSGDLQATLLDTLEQNISDMPVILQQRSMFTGPIPDSDLTSLFGQDMDLLSYGKDVPGAAEVSLSGISNGQASTHFLICGVFMHLTPPPFNFSIPGAAWTAPTVAGGSPVVPDAWTSEDAAAGGPLGLTGAQTLTKAYLDYGNWVQEGFYQFARAYNWHWFNGNQTTILDWPLRHIAKVIPSPQTDTSAQGSISAARYIAQANEYYRNGGPVTGGLASSAIFLSRNARRTGSANVGGTLPGGGTGVTSTFSPDNSADLVNPTFGGPGVQELGCNCEYFRLPAPIVFPRSVTLNMQLRNVSGTALKRAKNSFSMTGGVGGTPPGVILPDQYVTAANFVGNAGAGVFSDLTKDSPPVANPVKTPIGTAVFKIGDWYMTIGCCGYELNDAQYDAIKAARGDLTQAFQNAGSKLAFWC